MAGDFGQARIPECRSGEEAGEEASDRAQPPVSGPADRGRDRDIDLTAHLDIDLAFERAVFRNRHLSIFRRNATTWEALLMIARFRGIGGPGLYELVGAVETTALGQSALLRFLRERRDDGSILFSRSPEKQSKWTLAIHEDLRAGLIDLIRLRAEARGP